MACHKLSPRPNAASGLTARPGRVVRVVAAWRSALIHPWFVVGPRPIEAGQGTAEYALVLVAVTAMVGVVIAYVSGDGGGMITALFGAAFAKMRSLVGG